MSHLPPPPYPWPFCVSLCASSPSSSFFFFFLPSHPLFYCLLLSPSLAPSTQMLPTAQLGRSDGMCHLGITTIPTSYTASRNMAGWERIFGRALGWKCQTEKCNKIQNRRWAATKNGIHKQRGQLLTFDNSLIKNVSM